MGVIRQVSFAGGEIAPELWGRSDLPQRAAGLRTLRNFFVSRHGAALSRPGTTYVGQVFDSETQVRLIPFVFSDTQSYVLEFGEGYVWFYSNGGRVEVAPGVPVQLTTPYASVDVHLLKYVQSGDVLTVCCPGTAPLEITRHSHTSWSIADVAFDRPAPTCTPRIEIPTGGEDGTHPAREWEYIVTEIRRDAHGFQYESAPFSVKQSVLDFYRPWNNRVVYKLNTYVESGGNLYKSLANNNTNAVTDASHWLLDGGAVATIPPPTQIDPAPTRFPIYPDLPVTLRMASSYALLATDPNFIGYRIYRGKGGLFGWIADSKDSKFVDIGTEPDYARQPPQGRNPFKVYDGTGALVRTEHPKVVAYFEERRVFAHTDERPATLFLSATGDYANFDSNLIAIDSDGAEYELACRRREEIRSLVGLEKLIVPTNSSVWSFGGAGGGPLSAADSSPPDAKAHIQIGSSWVDPLVIANTVLMSRVKGNGVRDLFYDFQQQSYSGGDISFYAQHLFNGHSIVDWAYAEDPWGVVWAVRDDGKLLSLTYDRDTQMRAWAIHDTQGWVENVCCVPEGNEDAVYMVVHRAVFVPGGDDIPLMMRFVERLASRVLPLDSDGLPDVQETIALDCVATYRGPSATIIEGLDHLEHQRVMVLANGIPAGPYTVDGGTIDISDAFPDGSSVVHVGLAYTPEMELLDIATSDTRHKPKLVKRIGFEVEASRGLQVGESLNKPLTEWRQRRVADSYGAVSAATDVVHVTPMNTTWNSGGRAALRQTDPLFVTVLGVSRDVEVGE